jgi:hypothetical protein
VGLYYQRRVYFAGKRGIAPADVPSIAATAARSVHPRHARSLHRPDPGAGTRTGIHQLRCVFNANGLWSNATALAAWNCLRKRSCRRCGRRVLAYPEILGGTLRQQGSALTQQRAAPYMTAVGAAKASLPLLWSAPQVQFSYPVSRTNQCLLVRTKHPLASAQRFKAQQST